MDMLFRAGGDITGGTGKDTDRFIQQMGRRRGEGGNEYAQELMQAIDKGVLTQEMMQQIRTVTKDLDWDDDDDLAEYFGSEGVLTQGYRIMSTMERRKANQQMLSSLGIDSATRQQQNMAFAIGQGKGTAAVLNKLKSQTASFGGQDIVASLLGTQFERGLTQQERAKFVSMGDSYLEAQSAEEREKQAKAFAAELGNILQGRAEDYQTRAGTSGAEGGDDGAQNELNATLKQLRDHMRNESIVIRAIANQLRVGFPGSPAPKGANVRRRAAYEQY
jgi:hypothetical protein